MNNAPTVLAVPGTIVKQFVAADLRGCPYHSPIFILILNLHFLGLKNQNINEDFSV